MLQINSNYRRWILGGFTVLSIGTVFFLQPIPQNPHYHHFDDARTMLNIPHFWNVVSNAPFLLVGFIGLWLLLGKKVEFTPPFPPVAFFFIGIFLTGIGSAYYHWAPSNETLIWDRLPMTITFMSLLAAIISVCIHRKTGTFLLWIFLIIGIGTVLYWYVGEMRGKGDLRFYALVQFYPLLAIPMIVYLYPSNKLSRPALLKAILWYVLAKVFEKADGEVYQMGGLLSGHTLKHLASGAAVWQILLSIQYAKIIENPGKRKNPTAVIR
ncbi:MAG: ceramidase domain-containing protein [Bacteroidota bacterium]